VLALPLVGSLPDQPPEAVQLLAFVDDQLSVELEPLLTVPGLALRLSVGFTGADTLIVTDLLALPPAPLQVSVKAVVALSPPVLALPLVSSLPDQPPEAVQPLAFVEDQLSVAEPPLLTVVGFALRLTVGGAETLTVTDRLAVPPAPLQVSVKPVVALNAPVLALPLAGSLPDQPPLAVQLLALVEDQLSIADPPLLTLVGLALKLTVGGVATLTVTD
jgi:hypothetical protein